MDPLAFNNLGGVPSPKDYRDIPAKAVLAAEPLPDSYFVDIAQVPIWNQRKIGACVGHAHAKYVQVLNKLETGAIDAVSPRYIYALAKANDGYSDEGTYPRVAAKMVKDHGAALESVVPNDTLLSHADYIYNAVQSKVPGLDTDASKKYAIKGYAFVNMQNEDEIKRAIMQGNGVSILLQLGKEWWSGTDGVASWQPDKILPLRPPAEIVSGHQVFLYGFDHDNGRTRFHIINSWSDQWGNGGKGYFFYDEYKTNLIEGITFVDLPNDWLDEVHQLPVKPAYTFWWNLKYGMRLSKDVMELQNILKYEGFLPAYIPSTGNYLTMTAEAVLKFQKKYAIDTDANLDALAGKQVGPKTRAKLNELY